MARASMTGALVGATVGIQGIPLRFLDGLSDKDEILNYAEKVTALFDE